MELFRKSFSNIQAEQNWAQSVKQRDGVYFNYISQQYDVWRHEMKTHLCLSYTCTLHVQPHSYKSLLLYKTPDGCYSVWWSRSLQIWRAFYHGIWFNSVICYSCSYNYNAYHMIGVWVLSYQFIRVARAMFGDMILNTEQKNKRVSSPDNLELGQGSCITQDS